MKLIFSRAVLLTALFFVNLVTHSQNATIDYYAWNPSSPPCDVFAGGVNVSATVGGSNTTIYHGSLYGQPKYSTSFRAVELPVNYVSASDTRGTQYRLAYSFKQNYSYQITVNAAEVTNTQGTSKNTYLSLAISNSSGTTNRPCNGPDNRTRDVTGAQVINGGTTFTDYIISFNALTAANPSLDITAYSGVGGGVNAIRIKKITITETAPPSNTPTFTLPASTTITCGSTTAQNFTITNVYSTSGVTDYTWNLGSASNGWLYNGNAAPQTVSTGTSPTLTLTPVCGIKPSNISATVSIGASTYNTNISAVTLSGPPSLSISGVNTFCSGTETYEIPGLPCNAVVSWTSSDPNIASVPSSGNPVTVTKVGNGVITLTAIVNACGVQTTLTPKSIAIGTLPAPTALTFNGFTYTTQNTSTDCIGGDADYEVSVVNPVADASYWWDVSSGADFRFGQGDPDVGITVGDYPGSYFYVIVQPENSCGLGEALTLQMEICGNGLRMQRSNIFKISPNPATSIIKIEKNITAPDQKTKEQHNAGSITEVRIFDKSGNLKKQSKYPSGTTQAQLNISDLKAGIYFIEISNGQNKERQQLLIQK